MKEKIKGKFTGYKTCRLLAVFLAFAMLITCIPVTGKNASAASKTKTQRYTVLVLDIANDVDFTNYGTVIYTATSSINEVKQAAISFLSSIVNSSDENHVAVVTYSKDASIVSDFTTDIKDLKNKVNDIAVGNKLRNVTDGLKIAENLIDGIGDSTAIKNVIHVTTGMTNEGESSDIGKYDFNVIGSKWHRMDTEIPLYKYANSAVAIADELKNKATVYVLGLFQSMKNIPYEGQSIAAFFKIAARDIATSDDTFFDVDDPSNIAFRFGEIAQEVSKIYVPFSFTGYISKKDVQSKCYYSDAFFNSDATKYNAHLATMSLSFELTTWTSGSTSQWPADNNAVGDNLKCHNARKLLCDELDFEKDSFKVNDFWLQAPEKDSIGALAANKKLGDGSTLIALGVRGGGYGKEWASNFTMGKEGDHQGFATARDNVLKFLNNYIKEQDITGRVKLWIVGFSRAGAVANMVGGALNDYYTFSSDVEVSKEDTYVYTFEAPQGVLKTNLNSGNYANIHNIINLNDIVPLVAPGSWGFTRYANAGGEIKIPSKYTCDNYASYQKSFEEMQKDMFAQFLPFTGNDGKYDYKIKESVTQYNLSVNPKYILPGGKPFVEVVEKTVPFSEALVEATSFLFDGAVGDRDNFYYNYQAGVREILSLLYGDKISNLLKEGMPVDEFLSKFFGKMTIERLTDIIKPAFALNLDSIDTRKNKIKNNIREYVREVTEDSDLWGSALFLAGAKDTLTDLLWNLLKSTVDDCINNETKSLQSCYNLICGIKDGSLLQAHWPEIALAWMRSMDSFYNVSLARFEGNMDQCRIIHINCPVDVVVYDEKGNERARITYNKVSPYSDLAAYVNDDGEKIVVLPADGHYTIKYTATGQGNLNIGINELDMSDMSTNRVVNYYDIPINSGDVLNSDVPAYNEDELNNGAADSGSTTDYTLKNMEDENIYPSDDIRGSLEDNTYTVDVESNNNFGYVSGGGRYIQGNFAELSAVAYSGSTFEGWYNEAGELVSKDDDYRFAVKDNVRLTAHFTEAAFYEVKINATEGGTVEYESISATAGSKVRLKATPAKGYMLSKWVTDYGTIDESWKETTWLNLAPHTTTVTAVFTTIPESEVKSGSKDDAKVIFKTIDDGKSKNKKPVKNIGTVKIAPGGKLLLGDVKGVPQYRGTYKWTSSNKKLVRVNSKEKIIASKKAKGKTVTITGKSPCSSTIVFKVKVMKSPVKKIIIKGKKTAKPGQRIKLKAVVKGPKGSYKKASLKSLNTNAADILKNGKIRIYYGTKGNKIRFLATALDGSGVKKIVTVKVK